MTSLPLLAVGWGWQPSHLHCSPCGLSRTTPGASCEHPGSSLPRWQPPRGRASVKFSASVKSLFLLAKASPMTSACTNVGGGYTGRRGIPASQGVLGLTAGVETAVWHRPCFAVDHSRAPCVSTHGGPLAASSGPLPHSSAMAASHMPPGSADTRSLGH